jgi:hypothetical protein
MGVEKAQLRSPQAPATIQRRSAQPGRDLEQKENETVIYDCGEVNGNPFVVCGALAFERRQPRAYPLLLALL